MVRTLNCRVFVLLLLVGFVLGVAAGCQPMPEGNGGGPGHRPQALALSPYQELNLGRQAYREILQKYRLVREGPAVDAVREVGERIAKASQIKPLQREMNLHLEGYTFEWEFNVLRSDQVNAFCLPGGKVAVFTGLLPVVTESDGNINHDQLATVLSHEIAHALAHHASERVARQGKYRQAEEALNGGLKDMKEQQRDVLIGLLSPGTILGSLSFDRMQEAEADHIGLFLMTFADYDPGQAVVFWEKMQALSARHGRVPEILSDHPSDAHRIAAIERWVPWCRAALVAYKNKRIAPGAE